MLLNFTEYCIGNVAHVTNQTRACPLPRQITVLLPKIFQHEILLWHSQAHRAMMSTVHFCKSPGIAQSPVPALQPRRPRNQTRGREPCTAKSTPGLFCVYRPHKCRWNVSPPQGSEINFEWKVTTFSVPKSTGSLDQYRERSPWNKCMVLSLWVLPCTVHTQL